MDLFFVDDAQQKKPSRPGMGPLVATGGIYVPEESVRELEVRLDKLCTDCNFPPGEEFKWSPRSKLWMYRNLVEEERNEFFTKVLTLSEDAGVKVTVIIEDTNSATATGVESAEMDVTMLFLERAHHLLSSKGTEGIIIISRPGGDRSSENRFLTACLETLQSGTDYVKPDRIALNVLSSPSIFIRLLQVADIVTSCTTAIVAGETQYSPPIFNVVKRLFTKELNRIGGVGLKLHPDFKYANLYHWLLGDSTWWKHSTGIPLPQDSCQYSSDPFIP